MDVATVPDAHRRFYERLSRAFYTCPFEAKQKAPATVIFGVYGATCPNRPLAGMPVVGMESADNDATRFFAWMSCLAWAKDTPPPGHASKGPVYLLELTYPIDEPMPNALSRAITPAVWRSGLPFDFYDTFSSNGADQRMHEYACFEMLSKDDGDPASLFGELGVTLPAGVRQTKSDKPNCAAALKAMGVDMGVRRSGPPPGSR